jgi:glycosyltransferase involved in cell wall biosynthesis
MKLAFVTSYMFPHLGGIERIAENLFNGYVASGIDVRWLSSRIPAHLPPREGLLIRVPCFNLIERVCGVPVPIWGLSGWREVNRLARWADALHVLECLYVTSAMAVAAARRHGKPVLLSQNVGFVPYRSALLNLIEHAAYRILGRAVLRHATHVVLATPTAQAHAARLFGGPLPHSTAFPIGIDTERFRPPAVEERRVARDRLGLRPEERVVLFAGRLVEKKGVDLVVETSRQLPAVRFLVAGDGPLRDLLRMVPPNVTWRQTVPADDMPAYYAAADCVLLPSHGEGLPLVVQEAVAVGLPTVISQDEVYASALLDQGVCIGAERTVAAMTRAVESALRGDDPAFGGRARAFAVRHWGLETMIARYKELLEHLIHQRAVAHARPGTA